MQHLDRMIFDWIEAFGWPLDAVIRIAFAALAGGLVGLEREIRGREAGFRTNMLVCVGSAIVMIVSSRMAYYPWPTNAGFEVSVDPARIAYGVMGGIGFIGAGVIIKHNGSIRGLTTAAALWGVAGIGLATGIGLYLFSLCATALVVLGLWVFDYLEHLMPRTHYRKVTLRAPWRPGCVGVIVDRVRKAEFKVVDWTFERTPDGQSVDLFIDVAFRGRYEYDELERRLFRDGDGYEVLAVREA